MNGTPLQIVLQVDTEIVAAQITKQILENTFPISQSPHYVTKCQAVKDLGWSEYHLKQGETEGHLKPLRLGGKGEIRFSFQELSTYHNHLQSNGPVQVYSPNERSKKSKNASPTNRR